MVMSGLNVTSALDPLALTPGTLRYAVNQANTDAANGTSDTITFAPSLSGATIVLQHGPLEFNAGTGASIWGMQGDFPTISAQGSNVFQVDSGANVYLNGLTIKNGAAINADGGGINNAGILTVDDCTFSGNTATGSGSMGGAIYNTGKLIVAYPSTFTDNSAALGGAVANGPGGTATVENSTFTGNTAAFGGGIYSSGALTVYGCTLSGNSAEFGGGLCNQGGTVTLNTDTLAGNTATGTFIGIGQGGAIYNNGAMSLSATTVSANSGFQGGGIWNGSSLTLVDTIVAGNTLTATTAFGPDVSGSVATSSSYNLIGNGTGLSGISNGVNHNKIGTSSAPINPRLGPLGNNGGSTETMAVLPGSPAISSGGSITTLTSAITAGATVISVADAATIASTALESGIRIDGEALVVWSVNLTNNTLTVSPESSASSHSAGAGVYLGNDQRGTPVPDSLAIGAYQLAAGPAVSLTVSGPTSSGEIAGVPFNVTITAVDASGNTATGDYENVTSLTSSDGQYVFTSPVTLFNGSATVSVVLDKADNITLKASSYSITGTSSSFTVHGAAPYSLTVSANGTATAGVPFNATITAKDAFGNPANGFVTLTSSDNTLDSRIDVSNGSAVVPVTLDVAHTVRLTAASGSVTGTSGVITVQAGPTAHLTMTAPSPVTAGKSFQVTIHLTDAYGNPSSSSTMASININPYEGVGWGGSTNNPGTQTAALTLTDAGPHTLSATLPNIKPATCTVQVSSGPATQFLVTCTTNPVTVGAPATIDVVAQDAQHNDTNYSGTVTLSTNWGWAVLSSNSAHAFQTATITLSNGQGSAPVLIEGVGSTYVIVTDGKITSSMQNSISVQGDWYSKNIADLGIQTRAREDYYYGGNSITYDGLLDLFAQAESEEKNNNSAAGTSLQALVNFAGNSNVNMAQYLQELANSCLNPSAGEVPFLAKYYNAVSWTVNLGGASGGVFVLTVGGQTTSLLRYNASSSDVQSALDSLASVGGNRATVISPSLGTYAVTFVNQSLVLHGDGSLLSAGRLSITVGLVSPNIPVTMVNGQPAFGTQFGTAGVAWAAQTAALVNQWLLGSVHPDDSYVGTPASAYSVPSGTPTLFGPSGRPEASDVQQGAAGNCWLMAALADTAYSYPAMIQSMFIPHDNGTYTVRIYGGSPWGAEFVTVDDQLPNDGFSFDSPYVGGSSGFTVMWAALAEKAFAEVYGPGSHYAYQYLDGGGLNPSAGSAQYTIPAITGLATDDHGVGGLGQPKASDVANLLNPTAGMPEGQLVCLGTKSSPSAPVDGSHEYAVLCYDSSSGGHFLLYNPWGLSSASELNLNVTSATTNQIQLFSAPQYGSNAASIAAGDVIQIDREDMHVTGVSGNTLTVIRGLYNTTPTTHIEQNGIPIGVYLVLGQLQTTGNPVYGPWTQLENAPIHAHPPAASSLLGLFTVSPSFVNSNFDDLANTNGSANLRATGGESPLVNISIVGPATSNPASGSNSFLEGSLGSGTPTGLSMTPAVPLTQPESAQSPAATGSISANRLKALDAVLAARYVADQDRRMGLNNGNLNSDSIDALFAQDSAEGDSHSLLSVLNGIRTARRVRSR